MGYINFKEEKDVALKQLQNRKVNNKEIYEKLIKDKSLAKNYSPYEKLSYKTFTKESFGKGGVEDEENFLVIEKKDIICSIFKDCSFNNIKFKNCNIIGCTFENSRFLGGGVLFESCNFIKTDTISKPSLNKNDNFSCSFINCNMYPKFLNSNISHVIFENCNLKNSMFQDTVMTNSTFYMSNLKKITIQDCDMSGIKIFDSVISDLDFTDKNKTKLDEKSFIDKIPIRENSKAQYEGVYMTYETIANKFKDNTLNNNFGEYYFLGKKTQRKTLGFWPKVQSYLYYLSCGYGERPEYALLFSLGVIFLFAIIYLFTGITMDGEYVTIFTGHINTPRRFFSYLNETINLSVGMFAGVGSNNSEPHPTSYMIANIEIIIGVIMMGVGIGTLTRKLVR